jgi:hypothetical protein
LSKFATAERGSSGTPVTRAMWKSYSTMCLALAKAAAVASSSPKKVSTQILSGSSSQTETAPGLEASRLSVT